MAANLKIEPTKIRELVDDYRSGRLVIPEFQRDYVWNKKKAPLLLDSLYRSFPIAALLTWQSSDYATPRRRDPRPGTGRNMRWLIDGQQRIMTLSRAMSGDDDIEVLFNSETEKFSNMNAAIRRDPRWIRVAELFDDRRYMLLTRELPSSRRGIALQAKYDKVRAIRDYEVPVIRMVDHSFDEAVLAFERINTLATPLKRQDIQSARVAEAHAGLISDDVVPFMKSIEDGGFTRLNVMHLFRVCGFIAHPDGRDRKPLHELSRPEVESAWKATKKATMEAQHLLRAELAGVSGLSKVEATFPQFRGGERVGRV